MTGSTFTGLPDGAVIREMIYPSGNRVVRVGAPRPGVLVEPPDPLPRIGATTFYVPYTAVYPATVAGAPRDAIWVDVATGADAYFGALFNIWERGETFALLEHDVVCRPDVVEAFESCPEPWCAFGYADICHPECMEAWRNVLGCTRFRAEIVSAVPDAVSSVPPSNRDWHNVCDGLGENLRTAGFTHHWHFPSVEHFHHGQQP